MHILENMKQGFAYHKIITKDEVPIDYEFIEINRAFSELTGLSRDQVIGKRITEVFPEILDDPSEWIQRYGKVALTGESIQFEAFSKELQKTYKVDAFSYSNGYFVTIFSDITNQIKAEKELKEREEKYRNLYENMVDGYAYCKVIFDERDVVIDYEFLDVNPAFTNILGFSKEETVNKRITELFPGIENDPTDWIGRFGKIALTGEPTQFEAQFELLNKIFSIQAFSSDKGYFSTIFTDITEKIGARKMLQESEKKYRDLVETSLNLIWICDREGYFTYLNPAWEKLLGYKIEEMIGRKFTDFKDEAEAEITLEAFLNNLREETTLMGFETRYISKSGKEKTLIFNAIPLKNENNDIIGTQGTAHDISGRIKTEKELLKSEKRFRSLFENLPIAVRELDYSDVKAYLNDIVQDTKDIESYLYKHPKIVKECLKRVIIINDNQALLDLFKAKSKMDFNNLQAIFTDKTYNNYVKTLIAFYNGQEFLEFENEIQTFEGDKRDVLVRWMVPPEHRKSLSRVLVSFLDITDRKKLEAEILKSSKLESLGILAGGIAHDFNNLLTGISGNISLARLSTDNLNELEIYLHEAELASKRAAKLTKQLLTFSKGGSPILEKVAIAQIIEESSKFVLRGSNVSYVITQIDDLWRAEIDTSQIDQVIQNLVINAAQSMPDGGKIRIFAENVLLKINEQIHQLKAGNYIRISISDSGIGIPNNNIDKIFDPFFTTKQTGSGLGLAICYSIIQNHGGCISLESELGVGTTVSIYLPAIPRGNTIQEVTNKKLYDIENSKMASGKVLVMDDEHTVLKVIEKMLGKLGYQTVLVENGNKVITEFQTSLESNETFKFVILDLTISGGMGGKETIDHLLTIDPNIKAIVASGYSNDPILANYKKYGFCGKISKPFNFEELEEAIQSLNK